MPLPEWQLPPEATPLVLRWVALDLRRQAVATERLAEEIRDWSRATSDLLAEAAVYQALASWLEQEADHREQVGAAQGQGEWSSRD